MEIYGNPISGYTTEYYSAVIEEGKNINNKFIRNKISCGDAKDYCCEKQKINYNRMRKK
jgi:ribosomal protein S17E